VATLERELALRYQAPADFASLVEGVARLAEDCASSLWLFEVAPPRFRWVSSSYERLFGRPREELYEDARSWLDSVHPDDRSAVLAAFERTTGGKDSRVEYRIVRPDGELRWMLGRGVPVGAGEGAARYVVGLAQDVTGSKAARLALEATEERLRRLTESSIIGIIIADIHGRITEANDAFLRLVGHSVSDLPLRWDEMTPPEWRPLDERAKQEIAEKGIATPWEKEYIRKDGTRVHVLVGVALVDASSGSCVCFVLDLSERKRAELALARAHEELERKVAERTADLVAARDQLRLLTDSLPCLISYVGLDRRYRFVNGTHRKWYGLSEEQLLGRHVREVIGEETYQALKPYFARARSGEAVTWELEAQVGAGKRFVYGSTVPHFGADGAVEGFFVMVSDLTEQRRAELELRHAERLAAVGTLAAGIAHEINNPLEVILLAAQNAVASVDDPAVVKQALESILRSARRSASIVSRVLTFSRRATSPRSLGDLNVVARNASDLGRRGADARGARIELSLAERAPLMIMNQTEIEQVVVNLIQNSVQAGASRVEIRTERTEGDVRLSVRDDGEGMTPERAARMFDPFYTTRAGEGGTGLGLSILHGIVRDHGGRVDVSTKPGQGTTITAIFPRFEQGAH
jgi:PAS domain S-box-containing protein